MIGFEKIICQVSLKLFKSRATNLQNVTCNKQHRKTGKRRRESTMTVFSRLLVFPFGIYKMHAVCIRENSEVKNHMPIVSVHLIPAYDINVKLL